MSPQFVRRQFIKRKRKGMPANYFASSAPAVILDERYECVTGGSNKYWELKIEDKGTQSTGYRFFAEVKYGKMDTRGMSSNKDFSSAKACNKWANDKIQEKLDKGYVKVTPQQALMSTLQAQASKMMTAPQLKQVAASTAKSLFDSMPVGIAKEVIVTIIVGGEIIQETIK